jgi:GNAT superfamily N-acetyltransferase
MDGLEINFISKEVQKSEYDWANIIFNDTSVGKARCLINGKEFTIFSINVYPEFQGKGFGKAFVDHIKEEFSIIIADRVRLKAIGFWESEGFIHENDTENWIYRKS